MFARMYDCSSIWITLQIAIANNRQCLPLGDVIWTIFIIAIDTILSPLRALHELAVNRLEQLSSSDLASLTQLITKLQSPSAGGCTSVPGEQGAGDGAARPLWPPGRDVSLASLDVTEPLPPRLFPGDWADLSLVSTAAEDGEKRPPGEGDRARQPPSGAAGEPPPPPPKEPPALPATTSAVNQRSVADGGADAVPRPQRREPSISDTSRRLFGNGDQPSGGAEGPNGARRSDPTQDRSGRGDQVPDRREHDNQISGWSSGRNGQMSVGAERNDKISDNAEENDEVSASDGCGVPSPTSGDRLGGAAPSVSSPADVVPLAGGGGGDAARPGPVGCRLSEDGFQRSLARLTERLSDLQQGISRAAAAQALTP